MAGDISGKIDRAIFVLRVGTFALSK